jgi:hypothetical protein
MDVIENLTRVLITTSEEQVGSSIGQEDLTTKALKHKKNNSVFVVRLASRVTEDKEDLTTKTQKD